MAHSIDITYIDIIKEMFDNSNEVVVICHSESAKVIYLKKLIKLFGEDDFDDLKKK